MQRAIESFPSVAWLVVALFGAALVAHAEPIAPSGDDDTAAIAAAIKAATPDGTVELAEGTFLLSSTLTLDQGVTLKGASRDGTVLDFQKKCQGFIISHEGAVLRDLTVTKGYIKASGDVKTVYGGAIKMSAGLVENCLISTSKVDNASTSYTSHGGGIYTSGGTVSGCEFVGCAAGSSIKALGNALYIAGGTVTNCDIHANDGGYTSGNNVGSASAVVYLASGFLLNSKIHHNDKDGVPGVYQANGTMAHCLIYGNTGRRFGGGLYKTGGYTYYCTIWGNAIAGESSGISGAYVSGGTMKNCIIVGNGPATSSGGQRQHLGQTNHSELRT